MATFDIDRRHDWLELYRPFLTELGAETIWAHLRDVEQYASVDSRMEALAKAVFLGSANPYQQLRRRTYAFFTGQFTHAAFYHACRIVDPESYTTHGLLPCDIETLNARAEKVLGKSAELTAAIQKLRNGGYARHNARNVGLFYSRLGAMEAGDHYLKEGSEYLRILANEVGGTARARLCQPGQPALLRCVIPLAELRHSDVNSAAILPLREELTVRDLGAPPERYYNDWAFMYPAAIPPDRIALEFL